MKWSVACLGVCLGLVGTAAFAEVDLEKPRFDDKAIEIVDNLRRERNVREEANFVRSLRNAQLAGADSSVTDLAMVLRTKSDAGIFLVVADKGVLYTAKFAGEFVTRIFDALKKTAGVVPLRLKHADGEFEIRVSRNAETELAAANAPKEFTRFFGGEEAPIEIDVHRPIVAERIALIHWLQANVVDYPSRLRRIHYAIHSGHYLGMSHERAIEWQREQRTKALQSLQQLADGVDPLSDLFSEARFQLEVIRLFEAKEAAKAARR